MVERPLKPCGVRLYVYVMGRVGGDGPDVQSRRRLRDRVGQRRQRHARQRVHEHKPKLEADALGGWIQPVTHEDAVRRGPILEVCDGSADGRRRIAQRPRDECGILIDGRHASVLDHQPVDFAELARGAVLGDVAVRLHEIRLEFGDDLVFGHRSDHS
jgi:hypothetical protein